MRRLSILLLASGLFMTGGWAASGETLNLVVNPDFARIYAAQPLTNALLPYRRGEHQWLPGYDEGVPPFLPYGWCVVNAGSGQPSIARVTGEDRTALRVRTGSGERLVLRQQYIEVVPGAPYTIGIELRGRGRVRVSAVVQTPATAEVLPGLDAIAGEEWARAETTVQPGPHRRLLRLTIELGPDCDIQARGVRVETTLAEARMAPDLLQRNPAVMGPETLFLEGFDGAASAVSPGAQGRLSEAGGGRRGRGLVVSPAEGGSTSALAFGALPDVGSISFWFKPDRLPQRAQDVLFPLAIHTRTPGLNETRIQFSLSHWLGAVTFGFRKDRYAQDAAVTDSGAAGWGRWQPDTWHHFAGSWDGEVTRLYVDGVLEGILFGRDKQLPRGEAIDLVLAAAGTLDEIQIVRGQPFGPFVPAGAVAGSYLPPAPAAPPPAPPAAAAFSAEEAARLRRARLDPVPAATAEHVFEAAAMRPAWDGMAGLRHRKDHFGPGADAVEVSLNGAVGPAAFWRLEGIPTADYFVGVWTQTDGGANGEYSPAHLNLTAYRNGWPLRFSVARDPVQVKPGVWLTELQTADAVALQAGDEIAVVPHRSAGAQNLLRLALYRREPPRGHGLTGRTFGAPDGAPLRLRLVLSPRIEGEPVEGGALEAVIAVANPLPYEIRAQINWILADHYGAPLVQRVTPVVLAPHARELIRHPFLAEGRANAYQLTVRSRPAEGFQFPESRPADLLELYEGVQAELSPDLPDPLTVWNHTRQPLTTISTGFRRLVSLDGQDWQRADLAGRVAPERVPDGLAWRPVRVPVDQWWVQAPPDVFGYWYRRTFVPPDPAGDMRMLLEFEGGGYSATEITAYLNGQRIGGGFAQLTPLRVEVPPQTLRQGETNELVVCTRGAIALMHPDFVERYAPNDIHLNMENQQYPGHLRHTAHLGSVRALLRPSFAIRQALPLPDPATGKVAVLVRIENTGRTARKARLQLAFQQGGCDVPHTAAPVAVEVEAGQIVERRIEATVAGLKEYAPLQPALVRLSLTLQDEGRELDRLDQRFGYRSMRVQGRDLAFNGQPLRFFGYGPNFNLAHILEMENGLSATRCLPGYTHANYDRIGDVGVLTYRDLGFAWAQRWKKLNNTEFWNAMRAAAVEQVWEFGAHPAIVGWNLSNESYHYAPYSVGREGQERHGELIASLAGAIRNATQSDFWFLADGDEDLGGRINYCSFHYANHWGVFHGFSSNPRTYGHFDGVSMYTPDSFFLNLASQEPRHGTVLAMRPDWIYGDVAFADTESYWFDSQRNGIGVAKYIDDRAALSSALQFYSPRGMAWTKTSMEGYRDMGATGIKGIYWQSFYNLPAQTVSFTLPEMERRYYSGARFNRRVTLFDDDFRPGHLEFTWSLADPDHRLVREGRIAVRSTTAFLHRDRLAFDVPEVTARTPYTLTMELRKDGRRRAREERLVEVWPALPPPERAAPGAPRVALFDPSGMAAPVLSRLGINALPIDRLAAENLTAHRALVIGPHAAADGMTAERELLASFAAGGGRVLLLAQDSAALLPLGGVLERKLHTSIGFVRTAGHPVMAGLQNGDLQMWNPGHVVARGAYQKPDKGVFANLADTAHNGTLSWSLMLECPIGQGFVLAAQFPMIETFETEPMAAELLRRLLAYLGGPVRPAPSHRLAVLSGATEATLKRLSEVRAEFDLRTDLTDADSVILLDLDGPAQPPECAALRTRLEAGATVIVCRARPEHADWLTQLAGRPVTLDVQPYAAWADRQAIMRRDGLLAGLNNLDFYWRPPVPGEGWNSAMQVSLPPALERGQVAWIAKVDGVEDDLFPGGLVDIPVGAGRLVIDQIRWMLPEERLGPGSPSRILSVLLTHLGVGRRTPAPAPALPAGTRYEPIDLSAAANRSLRDDAAGDGKGWIDWGPDADLRSFPTGLAMFHGVPFRIPEGERNAIVLRLNPRYSKGLEELPDTVSIPVNRTGVTGLLFLHTGGWMFGLDPYGRREIEYADGTVEVLTLNQSNTGDWNPGWENFPDEVGTVTRVAWTGANPQYPVLRVYQTLWLNPHPEKEIRTVRITHAGLPEPQQRFLAHLALTAAYAPVRAAGDTTATAPAERDSTRSLRLLNEAITLADAGQQTQAEERLHAAIRADDRNIGAWIALAERQAETAEPDAFRALIERWTTALPESYQAYNIHGKYLEQHGRKQEALSAYRRSLELEWNQPFAIQAVERLAR